MLVISSRVGMARIGWKQLLPLVLRYMNQLPFEAEGSLSPWEVFKGRRLPRVVEVPAPVDDPRPSGVLTANKVECTSDATAPAVNLRITIGRP
jgi:hypothetical protein